jgi:hypothetical protein
VSQQPLTAAELDELEAQLHVLGRRELELEQELRRLRLHARTAGSAKRFDEADQAWALHEKYKAELPALQTAILLLERRLYSERRRQRS